MNCKSWGRRLIRAWVSSSSRQAKRAERMENVRGTCLFLIFGLFLTSCHTSKKANEIKEYQVNPSLEVQKKYAEILNVNEEKISKVSLYNFIDEWKGTIYKYGGKSKQGVDCSGFSSLLYKAIYNIDIYGSSENIFERCKPLSKAELREGNFVFFKIDSDKISHVGIYLQNDKFVHATTKAGVIISDLNEAYYKKYYYTGGELK